jgi:hypothetical protein
MSWNLFNEGELVKFREDPLKGIHPCEKISRDIKG